jgi:hypothetical protein
MALIVEDDPAVRESIADVARDGGYLVVEARDSDTALRALTTGGISVALIDLQLPGSMVGSAWRGMSLPPGRTCRSSLFPGGVLPFPGPLPQGSEFLGKPFREADLAKVLMAAA